LESSHVLEFDETALVRRSKNRDAGAFGQLVLRHQERILNLLYRMTGDYHAALDLCQDTFLKAYRSIASFEERSSLHTWLYRIATNLCLSRRRSQGRHPEVFLEGMGDRSGDDPAPQPADPTAGPEETAESRERRSQVHQAIQSLDPDLRSVVLLRDLEGLSYEEIAGVLSCPTGTVRSRLHRARLELKEKLRRVL